VTLWADLRSGEKLGAFCFKEDFMKRNLIEYLSEFKTLDSYLGQCAMNSLPVDIDIARMLTTLIFEKLDYYGRNFNCDEDPYFPAGCVDFVLSSR
jgi:hypothetical protein